MGDWRVFGDELRQLRLRRNHSLRSLAKAVNYDNGVLSRVENGKRRPSMPLAEALERELDANGRLIQLAADLHNIELPPRAAALPLKGSTSPVPEIDDMNRRELLRLLSVASAFYLPPALTADVDWSRLSDPRVDSARVDALAGVNAVLWNSYGSARTKAKVFGAVREQVRDLVDTLGAAHGSDPVRRRLSALLAEVLQLAGEILFDANRYTDAANCYANAATASREAGAFDLWACAMVRHSFIAVYDNRPESARGMLENAHLLAARGDASLSTRYWVSSVHAQALAGLGDSDGCRRALDDAERVKELTGVVHNGGWLRFDGSRLAEERGRCHLQLREPDRAEAALTAALEQDLTPRRRGAVLTDLAIVGAQRRDPVEIMLYGGAALDSVRRTKSGYVGHKLHDLQAQLGPFLSDRHIRRLDRQITELAGAAPQI